MLSLLPNAPEWISLIMPLPLEQFFSEHWDQRMLRINHTDHDGLHSLLWDRGELRRDLASLAADEKLTSDSRVIAAHGGDYWMPGGSNTSADEALQGG